MREQMQTRLEALKKELETGQSALEKIEQQRTYLHQTILRIGGAIQVLEELLAEALPFAPDEIVSVATQATVTRDHALNGQ